MTAFLDLLAADSVGDGAGTGRGRASRLFSGLLGDGPLHHWRPGDPIPHDAVRLLIGVAPWSAPDMALLDFIVAALGREPSALPTVDVFDVTDCPREGDVRRYIPGLREASHTPVAGMWFGGLLTWYGQGDGARDRVARMFGAAPACIAEYVRRSTGLPGRPPGA